MYPSSQRVTSLLNCEFTFLKNTWPKKQVLDFPLLKRKKRKSPHSPAGRHLFHPPSFLLPLGLALCLLVVADVLTDQGFVDVTKESVCFKMLLIFEVPRKVTKKQCQGHEPFFKKLQKQGCGLCRTDTQRSQHETTPNDQLHWGQGQVGKVQEAVKQ